MKRGGEGRRERAAIQKTVKKKMEKLVNLTANLEDCSRPNLGAEEKKVGGKGK